MATKKDYLRAAILSGGATAAMPSTSAIAIPIGRYIAPTNGYVCVQANGSQLTSYVAVTLDQGVQQIIPATAVGQGLSAYIPIGKGQSVSTVAQDFSAVNCLFVKLVGGGKNPVAQPIRRVVLCLRTTFGQCLSRTEKRIEAHLIQQLRYREHFLRYLNRVMGRCHTLPPLMGWLRYSFPRATCTTQFVSVEEMYSQRSQAQLQQDGLRLRSSLRRERKLLGLSVQESVLPPPSRLVLGDSGNQLARNLVLGGASHA